MVALFAGIAAPYRRFWRTVARLALCPIDPMFSNFQLHVTNYPLGETFSLPVSYYVTRNPGDL